MGVWIVLYERIFPRFVGWDYATTILSILVSLPDFPLKIGYMMMVFWSNYFFLELKLSGWYQTRKKSCCVLLLSSICCGGGGGDDVSPLFCSAILIFQTMVECSVYCNLT